MEVGTLFLSIDKNCYCQLFIRLFSVLKILGVNGYLKCYLKSNINKIPKKINK